MKRVTRHASGLNEEEVKISQALTAWRQRALKADLLLGSTAIPRSNAGSSSYQASSSSPSDDSYERVSPQEAHETVVSDAGATPTTAFGSGPGAPGEAGNATRCGVSLRYLRELFESLDTAVSKDMYSLVHKLVSPIARSEGKFCRFWDLIPRTAVGPPQYFVVHAWGTSLKDLLAQLEYCLLTTKRGTPSASEGEVYVWLSAFATSQVQKPMDVDMVKELIKTCSKGMVVVVDPSGLLLTRLWCCYEIWAASYYGEHNKIKMAFHEDISIEQMTEYENTCQRLSLMQCDTSKAEDKTMLLSSIKGSVGLKIMTKMLSETMLRSSRVSLRFSDSVKSQALYCALLLKGGEYCRCQQVLCNLENFGLDDDDRMLEEMKGIFRLYDEDGSGELGRDEFVHVLSNTGFGADEADRIFDEINTDGSSGVSIEEWQEWWMSSRKPAEKPRRRRMVMVASGLIENIEKMVRLMQQNHLDVYAAFFKDFHKKLSDGSIMKPTQVLAASPLKGDWAAVLDQIMFSVHKKLYRQACQPLYDLLMWNSDSMDFNPNDLPSPQQLQGDTAMMQGLQMYMQLFSSILAHQPGRGRHAEYLLKSAIGLPTTARDQDPKKKDQRVKQDKNDAARFQVVRNMISLKYGKDQPFCENLIAEAEMSLGQMMANKKGTNNGRDGFAENLNTSYIKGAGALHGSGGSSLLGSSAMTAMTGRKDASDELIEQIAGTVADMGSKKTKEYAASETARKGLSLACQSFKRLASRRIPSEGGSDPLAELLGEDAGHESFGEEEPKGSPRRAPGGRGRSRSLLIGAEQGSPLKFPGINLQSPSLSDHMDDHMNSPRYALVTSEQLKSPRFMPHSPNGAGGLATSPLSGDAARSPRGAGNAAGLSLSAFANPPVGRTRLPSIRWSAQQVPEAPEPADDDSPARPQRYTSIMRLPSLAETREAGNVVEDLIAKVVRAPSFANAGEPWTSPRGTSNPRRMSALDAMLSTVKDSPLHPLLSRLPSSKARTPRA